MAKVVVVYHSGYGHTQRVAQQVVVRGAADDGRDVGEAHASRRAPPALTHDELVGHRRGRRIRSRDRLVELTHDDRLEQPELPDRVLELGEGVGAGSGIVGQEEGVITPARGTTLEEEVDNWDENAMDDWDEDENEDEE